jgi:hypothetical protein
MSVASLPALLTRSPASEESHIRRRGWRWGSIASEAATQSWAPLCSRTHRAIRSSTSCSFDLPGSGIGIATALLSDAMNELHDGGEAILKSAYHAANETSMDWHQRFGFVEESDLMRALLYSSIRSKAFSKRSRSPRSNALAARSNSLPTLPSCSETENVNHRPSASSLWIIGFIVSGNLLAR